MKKNNVLNEGIAFTLCCCVGLFVKLLACTFVSDDKSAMCHGSSILSAIFMGQLNRTHKSWHHIP